MDPREMVKEYYAQRAREYDASAGYLESASEAERGPMKRAIRRALRGRDVLEVACGTGYWSAVIAASARSVLATDADPGMIDLALKRHGRLPRLRFMVADAYSLDGVSVDFNAAFAHWWWSHVPRQNIQEFLGALHGRLLPGSLVLFTDQMPYEARGRRIDADGNAWERRTLTDGRTFEVIKNFPTEEEIRQCLRGRARRVRYRESKRGYWTLTYLTEQGK